MSEAEFAALRAEVQRLQERLDKLDVMLKLMADMTRRGLWQCVRGLKRIVRAIEREFALAPLTE